MLITKRASSLYKMLGTKGACSPSSLHYMLGTKRVCCQSSLYNMLDAKRANHRCSVHNMLDTKGHAALALDIRGQAGTASNRACGR